MKLRKVSVPMYISLFTGITLLHIFVREILNINPNKLPIYLFIFYLLFYIVVFMLTGGYIDNNVFKHIKSEETQKALARAGIVSIFFAIAYFILVLVRLLL
jgi:hypothetical protein